VEEGKKYKHLFVCVIKVSTGEKTDGKDDGESYRTRVSLKDLRRTSIQSKP